MNEQLDFEKWLSAFEEVGLDPAFYAYRSRSLDEVLPWSHIDVGTSLAFLKQEYQRTWEGLLTPDCSQSSCNTCGLEDRHPACMARQRA